MPTDAPLAWARRSVDAARVRAPFLWAVGVAIVLGGLGAVLTTVDMKSGVWIGSAANLAFCILFLANVRWLERALELPARIMAVHPLLWFLGVPAAMLGSFVVWWAMRDGAPGVATGALVLGFAGIGFLVFWAWSLLWGMALEALRTRQALRFAATLAVAGSVYWGWTMLWAYLA